MSVGGDAHELPAAIRRIHERGRVIELFKVIEVGI